MSKNGILKEIFKAAAVIIIPTASLFAVTYEAARYLTTPPEKPSTFIVPIEKGLVTPIKKQPIKKVAEIHP